MKQFAFYDGNAQHLQAKSRENHTARNTVYSHVSDRPEKSLHLIKPVAKQQLKNRFSNFYIIMQRRRKSGMEKKYQENLSTVINVIQLFNISTLSFHVGIHVKLYVKCYTQIIMKLDATVVGTKQIIQIK